MKAVALLVVTAWAGASLWAWSRAPGRQAAEQFLRIWQVPWGKQFFVDFFGLEIVLALWMLSDAGARGTWALSLVCIAAMPVFGALPPAFYWLTRAL
jgi:hypothetical protein